MTLSNTPNDKPLTEGSVRGTIKGQKPAAQVPISPPPSPEKLRRGVVDDMYAVRNKMFRGKMRELIRCFIHEVRPGIFRVYLCLDGKRTPVSPEFTDITAAKRAQGKAIEEISLEMKEQASDLLKLDAAYDGETGKFIGLRLKTPEKGEEVTLLIFNDKDMQGFRISYHDDVHFVRNFQGTVDYFPI